MKPFEDGSGHSSPAMAVLDRLFWRVGLSVFAIVFLLSVATGLVQVYDAFRSTEQVYRRDAGLLAETVARSVQRPLLRAAEYNIPLARIPDGDKFLAGILGNAPALARLEVRDAEDKSLFSSEDRARLATAFTTARFMIATKSGPVASVLATQSLNEATTPFVNAALLVLGIAVAAAAAAGTIAALLTRQMIVAPARKALATLRKVEAGEIVTRAPSDIPMEFAPFWSAFRSRVRRVGDRWTALAGYASELEVSDYENKNQHAIADVIARLRQSYSLPYVVKTGTSGSSSDGST